MSEERLCDACEAPLPAQRRGRPRTLCDACKAQRQRDRRNARDRQRYAEDPEFREAQLEARHARYRRNLEHERKRSKRYYERNREAVLARVKANAEG